MDYDHDVQCYLMCRQIIYRLVMANVIGISIRRYGYNDHTCNFRFVGHHDGVIKWKHFPFLALCAGNSPVNGKFPAQRLVTRSFDVFFDLHPNKRLSKQSRGWWFETPPCPLWRHCNVSLLHSPRLVVVCNIVTGDTGWNNGTIELVNRTMI